MEKSKVYWTDFRTVNLPKILLEKLFYIIYTL